MSRHEIGLVGTGFLLLSIAKQIPFGVCLKMERLHQAMTNSDAKKSETLEVRVSYETKRKLSAKAKSEGRTVSDVVRNLIGAYLTDPISTTHNSKLGDAAMFIKKLFTQKPKTALATMAALLMSPLLIIPSATAENLIIDIEGEHIQPAESDGVRKRTFETEVELETGTTLKLGFDGQLVTTDSDVEIEGDWLSLQINDVENLDGKKILSMTVSIFGNIKGEEKVIAEPTIKAVYGEVAEFKMMTEGFDEETGTFDGADNMTEFSLKFTPRAKS